jgi:broad specificity phosphatase PhoE
MSKKRTTIYLIRHGETDWNTKKLIQGQTDTDLTELGVTQAQNVAKELKGRVFDAIYASDLTRTVKTANIIASEHNLAVKKTHLLRERSMGIYEGLPKTKTAEIEELYLLTDVHKRYEYKPHHTIESEKEVVERLLAHIKEVTKLHTEKEILFVTHQGVIRVFLRYLGYINYSKRFGSVIENAGYVKIETDGETFSVIETKGLVTEHVYVS